MLLFYAFTIGLGVFQFGWATFGNTPTAPVFIAKFDWSYSEAKLYNTLISNSSIVGLLIGSVTAGSFIAFGRHRAIILMDIFVLIGSGISLIQTIPTILIRRFIYGFAAGVLTAAMTKCMCETVPLNLASVFGAFTAVSINAAGVICLLLGLTLPSNPKQYKYDENWRLIYGFNMIFAVL